MSDQSLREFSEKLKRVLEQRKPFAIFRKPEEDKVWIFTDEPKGKNCFRMHSFDSKTEKYICDSHPIYVSQSDFDFEGPLNLEPVSGSVKIDREKHIELVKQTIATTKKGEIPKIVIARTKEVPNEGYSVFESFKNLLDFHPGAMVWLWHNPGEETWMGATPELLLRTKGNTVNTVALAGTRRPEVEWTQKEYEEQQFVTDFILENLADLEELEVRGPETIVAGKLRHLKSYISGKQTEGLSTKTLLERLHPTPAVCGEPKKESFDFIVNHESFNREFYTGYIGVEIADCKEYFVNLRCTRLFEEVVRIFVGGGITADSDPVKEWEETEFKSGTLLNALQERN